MTTLNRDPKSSMSRYPDILDDRNSYRESLLPNNPSVDPNQMNASRRMKRTFKRMNTTTLVDTLKTAEYLLPDGYDNLETLKATFQTEVERKKEKMFNSQKLRKAHEKQLTGFAFASDGSFFITSSIDKSVKKIKTSTHEVLFHKTDYHLDPIKNIALSRNDQLLASVDYASVQIQNLATEEVTRFMIGDATNPAISVAFMPDNEHVVVGMRKKIDIVHIKDGVIQTIDNPTTDLNLRFDLSEAKGYLLIVTDDGKVRIHKKQGAIGYTQKYTEIKVTKTTTYDVKMSPDGLNLFIAGQGGIIKVNLDTKEITEPFADYYSATTLSVAISHNGQYVAASAADKTLRVFDSRVNEEIYNYPKDNDAYVFKSAFSTNSIYLITAAQNGTYRCHNFLADTEFMLCHNIGQISFYGMIEDENSNWLAVGSRQGNVIFYDFKTKEVAAILKEPEEYTRDGWYEISRDKKYLLFRLFRKGESDKENAKTHYIEVLDLKQKKLHHIFKLDFDHKLYDFNITSDNKYIYVTFEDQTVKKISLETNTEDPLFHCRNPNISDDRIESNLSVDDRYIIYRFKNGHLSLLDIQSQVTTNIEGIHKSAINCLTQTYDTNHFVTAGQDGGIYLFDIKEQFIIHKFMEDNKVTATSISVSNDDRYLVVGFSDGYIRVLDLETKQMIYEHQSTTEAKIVKVQIVDNKYIVAFLYGKTAHIEVFKAPFCPKEDVSFSTSKLSPYLTAETIEDMIAKCTDEAELSQFVIKYHDLSVRPHDWTILHYMAIFKPQAFLTLPAYSKAKVSVLTDKAMKTPLHYLLAQGESKSELTLQNNLFTYMLDYLEDAMNVSFYNYKLAVDSLSPILPVILSKLRPALVARFLGLCDQETRTSFGVMLPGFGGNSELRFAVSQTAIIQPEVQEKIYIKEGKETVDFQSLMLKLNYNTTSQDMMNTVETISSIENEAIFNVPAVTRLINHLWGPARRYHLTLGVLFSLLMIAISVYFALKRKDIALLWVIIALTSIFVVLELIQMKAEGIRHFASFWNYVDALFLAGVVFKVIQGFINHDPDTGYVDALQDSWICAGVLFAGYVRWVSFLQIFEPTRTLIKLILNVFVDVWPFGVVVGFILLCATLIFYGFNDNLDASFVDQLFSTYGLLFANFDDNASASGRILITLMLFLVPIVLVNLLVSILGNTFGNCQDQKVFTNNQTQIEYIVEYMSVYRTIFRASDEDEPKGYLISCGPQSEHECTEEEHAKMLLKSQNEMKDKIHEIEEEMLRRITEVRSEITSTLKRQEGIRDKKMSKIEEQLNSKISEIQSESQATRLESQATRSESKAARLEANKNHLELLKALGVLNIIKPDFIVEKEKEMDIHQAPQASQELSGDGQNH